jgi:hypothetical protein
MDLGTGTRLAADEQLEIKAECKLVGKDKL